MAGRATAAAKGGAAPGPSHARKALLAALLAWLLPGAGHAYLGRRGRAVVFFLVVAISLGFGFYLQGLLSAQLAGHPLEVLRTLGCLGLGLPYFVAQFLVEYRGHIESAGHEYGSVFILSAGLMNLLLVLDAWDIAMGIKEAEE